MTLPSSELDAAQKDAAPPRTSELIYRLEDRPPLPQTLFAAVQHLLAMFVAVITPASLICQALGLPAQDIQHIISMSLFASGLAPILQIKTWGPVDSGLLSIQGTSFNFVSPLIMGGLALKNGGTEVPTMMAALFGTLMVASCTEILLSRVLYLARRIITPLVSGIVVMIVVDSSRADLHRWRLCRNEQSQFQRAEKPAAGRCSVDSDYLAKQAAQSLPARCLAGDRHGSRLPAVLGDGHATRQ